MNNPAAFGYPLRRTTRNAIFLHPLFWQPIHLKFLRIEIANINGVGGDGGANIIIGHRSSQTERLPDGCISINANKGYWGWVSGDGTAADWPWLWEIVASIIESAQNDFLRKPFIVIDGYGPQNAASEIIFRFVKEAIFIQPEGLVRTRETCLPFLCFSSEKHRTFLREMLKKVYRDGCEKWKLLNHNILNCPFDLELEVDPYDVACLITMAQEQHTLMKGSYLMIYPKIYTVYLITPNPSSATSICLLTCKVPISYLHALQNLDYEVKDDLIITRQVIKIPPKSAADKLSEGPFVAKITEILEDILVHHRAMRQAEKLEDNRVMAMNDWVDDGKADENDRMIALMLADMGPITHQETEPSAVEMSQEPIPFMTEGMWMRRTSGPMGGCKK